MAEKIVKERKGVITMFLSVSMLAVGSLRAPSSQVQKSANSSLKIAVFVGVGSGKNGLSKDLLVKGLLV